MLASATREKQCKQIENRKEEKLPGVAVSVVSVSNSKDLEGMP